MISWTTSSHSIQIDIMPVTSLSDGEPAIQRRMPRAKKNQSSKEVFIWCDLFCVFSIKSLKRTIRTFGIVDARPENEKEKPETYEQGGHGANLPVVLPVQLERPVRWVPKPVILSVAAGAGHVVVIAGCVVVLLIVHCPVKFGVEGSQDRTRGCYGEDATRSQILPNIV